jgi:diguanylate cyclase (GGDEF)-like protein/PAS domain S-box-containing protein
MAAKRTTKFDGLIAQVSDCIAVHGADGELTYLSPAAERMLGVPVTELMEFTVASRVHPDDVPHLTGAFMEWMRCPGIGLPTEYRLAHTDGHWVDVESVGNNRLHDPDIAGVVVTTRDISERKRLEQVLVHRAMHDELTGLPNRALLADRLEQAISVRGRSLAALLFIDLDRFKVVNDTVGHAAGDRLLVEVAHRLRSLLRPGDTLARMGGDEFVVLCPGATATEAARVADRILEALASPVALDHDTPFTARASIGIAVGDGTDTAAQLLSAADAAMYRAKALGGGRYHILDDASRTTTLRELQMETELAQALDRGQLEMYFQPVVSLVDGAVTGAEALMRWQHPVFGAVGPAEFIPVAERSGSIIALGRWAMLEAARHAASWEAALGRPFEVAVNLSARQLAHPAFLADLGRALAHPGLSRGSVTLSLEVTESMLVADPEQVAATLRLVREHGCRVSLDDFGTGFSSFGHLRQFPIDILKIDRCFVAGMLSDSTDRVLVEVMITLAQCLGIDVIAEGVEHAAQAQLLHRLGCRSAQGFLWSKPVAASGFLELIARRAA